MPSKTLPWVALLSLLALGCSQDALPAANPDAGPSLDGPLTPDGSGGIDSTIPVDVGTDLAVPVDLPAEVASNLPGDVGSADVAVPVMCQGPVPGCFGNQPGRCDPVCQQGCGCQQRCQVVGGNALCAPAPVAPRGLQQDCDARDDQCGAGLICLQESPERPACGAHCFRHCRTSADCPTGTECDIQITFGGSDTPLRVCGLPLETCNPVGKASCGRVDRPSPAFGCYVASGANPDGAVCDCAGTKKDGEACFFERECSPGLECVKHNDVSQCRKICRLGAAGDCGALRCLPFPGQGLGPSRVHGFCAQ